MLQITHAEIEKSGGWLAALTAKSAEFIRLVLGSGNASALANEDKLRRTIVHTEPHLDEYLGELLFRACLQTDGTRLEFVEQSLFSVDNDLACKHLWPNAAIFGIGSVASGGADPLYLFDEHLEERGRAAPSSSQVVADKLLKTVPDAVGQVLSEVNAGDKGGGSHPQHLGNAIKILNEAKFLFAKGATPKGDKRDTLPPFWKRAIVDACLAAVVYCLHNRIDLVHGADIQKKFLQASQKRYAESSLNRQHPHFSRGMQFIASNSGGVEKVFKEATYTNQAGCQRPQLLILPRICYACHQCWGVDVAESIMMHLWETEVQKQLNFWTLQEELGTALSQKTSRFVTKVGTLRREILPSLQINDGKGFRGVVPLWLISFSQGSGIFRPNQALLSYLNKHNHGLGIILLENPFIGTKTLFRGPSLPIDKWTTLVRLIQSKETSQVLKGKSVWYDPSSTAVPADFLSNGNKAHQYMPRSGLDLDSLAILVRKTFFSQ